MIELKIVFNGARDIFYKDEGGKANHLQCNVTLVGDVNEIKTLFQNHRTIPLSYHLYYEEGDQMKNSDMSKMFELIGGYKKKELSIDDIKPALYVYDGEVIGGIRWRLNKVSRSYGGRRFRLKVTIDKQYLNGIELKPVFTQATTVLSKRKNKYLKQLAIEDEEEDDSSNIARSHYDDVGNKRNKRKLDRHDHINKPVNRRNPTRNKRTKLIVRYGEEQDISSVAGDDSGHQASTTISEAMDNMKEMDFIMKMVNNPKTLANLTQSELKVLVHALYQEVRDLRKGLNHEKKVTQEQSKEIHALRMHNMNAALPSELKRSVSHNFYWDFGNEDISAQSNTGRIVSPLIPNMEDNMQYLPTPSQETLNRMNSVTSKASEKFALNRLSTTSLLAASGCEKDAFPIES